MNQQQEVSSHLSALLSGDDDLAEAAVYDLARYGADILPHLIEFSQSSNIDDRWWAIRALAEIDCPDVPSLLHNGLSDLDPAVRQCAALGLQKHPYEPAIPTLVGLLDGKDRLLARLAAHALEGIGNPAVPALIQALESGGQSARIEATRALAEIKDDRSVPILFQCIQNGDSPLVEYWADIALKNMGFGMTFFKP